MKLTKEREAEIRAIGAWTSLKVENPLEVRDELLAEIDELRNALSDIRNKTILWRRDRVLEVVKEVHAIAEKALGGNPDDDFWI